MKNLIHEIHRRSLWQVLGIYLAGGWIALQVVEQLAEATGLPPWIRPLALALLVIGLPVVLATAFVQEGLHPQHAAVDAGEERPVPKAPRATGLSRILTWRNALLGAGGALAVWGLIAAGWIFLGQGGPGPPSGGVALERGSPAPTGAGGSGASAARYVASVAVMPFDNLGDPDADYLSNGFTEEVNAELARIDRLKVISTTSVMAIRDANLTLPEIGDTLDVEHVLRGSVRESGDQIRVTVELMDVRTDAIVWVDTYTREKGNIFALQDEIAGRVSSALIQNFAGLAPTTSSTQTVSGNAYEAYLRGRQAIHARTDAAFREAISSFGQAIAIDSSFAPAYAGLGMALGLSNVYGYQMELGPYERFGEALRLATRAIELDPDLAEGWGVRSYVEVKGRAPIALPLADVERAVELRPNSADMRGWYAHSLSRAGRHEEAMAQARMAIELDPIAPGRRVGMALDAFAAGEHQMALDEARSALALQPGLGPPRTVAAYALLLLRRPAECLDLDLPETHLARIACLHAAGQEEAAGELVRALAGRARSEGDASLSDIARANLAEGLAIYYARLGDADAVREWHQLAFSLSPDGVDFRLYAGGLFDAVRGTDGFEESVEAAWRAAWDRVSAGTS
ncbi:MAG: hypothetical protein ACC682_05850 [Gemmatimonadota bacterium]